MTDQASDEQFWRELVDAERNLIGRRIVFFNRARDQTRLLREALHTPRERGTALRCLLELYHDDLKKQLLPDLLKLASVIHDDIDLVRRAILSIRDRPWLLEAIDPIARDILEAGDDEEYQRIAELYQDLDESLLQRHLERCRNHPNPYVREIADDSCA
jgi:hypothetical protein